jgi:hypothetical protein
VQWNAQKPAPEGRIIPLESVLEHVLAPIAAAHPTLLLVMDGLSTSIFRELFARIASQGWAEMVPSSDLGTAAGSAWLHCQPSPRSAAPACCVGV